MKTSHFHALSDHSGRFPHTELNEVKSEFEPTLCAVNLLLILPQIKSLLTVFFSLFIVPNANQCWPYHRECSELLINVVLAIGESREYSDEFLIQGFGASLRWIRTFYDHKQKRPKGFFGCYSDI